MYVLSEKRAKHILNIIWFENKHNLGLQKYKSSRISPNNTMHMSEDFYIFAKYRYQLSYSS